MTTTRFNLAIRNFFQDWTNRAQITGNSWDGVESIVGYQGNVTAAEPTGLDPRGQTAPALGTAQVFANQLDPTAFGSGGVAEFEIENSTVALQGSGTADAPSLVVYLDATGRENIRFSANIRDLDGLRANGTSDNAIQQVAVQYRVGGTANWINVEGGYIADATTAGSATQVTTINVTLPAAANNAAELEIRILTTNAVGADEWVGIDDIAVTSTPIATAGNGSFTIADASVLEGNEGTTSIAFVVNRAGGSTGAATVDFAVSFPGTANRFDLFLDQPLSGTLTFADGATTATVTLQVVGDVDTESDETFAVTLSNPTGGALIGDADAVGTIRNDDFAAVSISAIQGAGHRSAFAGQTVTTTGVVTARDTNGFYIQDANGDNDLRTSDGVFVFTSAAPAADVVVGKLVRVVGTVGEFGPAGSLTVTQIQTPTVSVLGDGTVVAPTLIGTGGRLAPTANYEDDNFTSFDPATDALDFYESMEGMVVTVQAPIVVAETNRFGETFVVASGGAGSTGINARGGITVGPNDFNPERLQIDDDAGVFAGFNPAYTQGDRLSDVTGILNYAFQTYEVIVTASVAVTDDRTLLRETTALTGDATGVTIATYNLENLDPTDPRARFDLFANDIVFQLRAPDIIGVQEIQDADGAGSGTNYSGTVTAQILIDAIVAAGGPTYRYAEVAPTGNNQNGGEPNGNIRNGFLYNPDRVSLVEGSVQLIVDPAFNGSRKPLVADFRFNGETVTAINMHSTSRIGSDGLQGSMQPPSNAGDAARTAQATAVRKYIDDRTAADAELNVVTLGDFNGFYFEASLGALQNNNGLVNLHTLLPVEERYSFLFEGNLQPLDNILVSANLAGGATFDAVHLNAEQPEAANRPTDHDPLLAKLTIGADDRFTGTAGNDVRVGRAGDDFFSFEQGGDDRASGGTGDDGFFFGAALTAADVADGGADNDQVGLQGNYAGLLLGAGNLVGIETLVLLPGSDTRFGNTPGALFSYDLTTVDANVAAGQTLTVNMNTLRSGENVTFNGAAETDGTFLFYGGSGSDVLSGGGGSDAFFFGTGKFNSGDRVNGGGGADDQLGFQGEYSGANAIVLGASQVAGIETIVLLSGLDTRFGGAGTAFAYDLTTNDGNVDGGLLTINANTLRSSETLTFDGSAEDDGGYRIFSGAGDDRITGGGQADEIVGGAGRDTIRGGAGADAITGGGGADSLYGDAGADLFRYDALSDSAGTDADMVFGFERGVDRFDLSGIDADGTIEGNQAFAYIGEATFSGKAGELRFSFTGAATPRVEVDVDGDRQADLTIVFTTTDNQPLTGVDFIL